MRVSSSRGFSLVELLVTLVIIGILSAITIPSLLNAIDRGKQKRTMSDVRLLAGSLETYCVDTSIYPPGSSVTALNVIVPDYLGTLITTDGWGHTLIYSGAADDYTIGSVAKDGGSTLTLIGGGGPTHGFADDIIFRTGKFLQWPEGVQHD